MTFILTCLLMIIVAAIAAGFWLLVFAGLDDALDNKLSEALKDKIDKFLNKGE